MAHTARGARAVGSIVAASAGVPPLQVAFEVASEQDCKVSITHPATACTRCGTLHWVCGPHKTQCVDEFDVGAVIDDVGAGVSDGMPFISCLVDDTPSVYAHVPTLRGRNDAKRLSLASRFAMMHLALLEATPVPEEVSEVVDRFPQAMDTTAPADRPPPLHSVSLPFIDNPTPYYRSQFRLPDKDKEVVDPAMEEMAAGPHPVIEPTGAGEWCSPYNVHREKRRNPRVVFNYKGTNLILKDLKFPISVIDELLQEVSRGHIFSVLDLKGRGLP